MLLYCNKLSRGVCVSRAGAGVRLRRCALSSHALNLSQSHSHSHSLPKTIPGCSHSPFQSRSHSTVLLNLPQGMNPVYSSTFSTPLGSGSRSEPGNSWAGTTLSLRHYSSTTSHPCPAPISSTASSTSHKKQTNLDYLSTQFFTSSHHPTHKATKHFLDTHLQHMQPANIMYYLYQAARKRYVHSPPLLRVLVAHLNTFPPESSAQLITPAALRKVRDCSVSVCLCVLCLPFCLSVCLPSCFFACCMHTQHICVLCCAVLCWLITLTCGMFSTSHSH